MSPDPTPNIDSSGAFSQLPPPNFKGQAQAATQPSQPPTAQQAPNQSGGQLGAPKSGLMGILSSVLGKHAQKELATSATEKWDKSQIYLKTIGDPNSSPQQVQIALDELGKSVGTKGHKEVLGKVTQLLQGIVGSRTAEGRQQLAQQKSQASSQAAQAANTQAAQEGENTREKTRQDAEAARNAASIQGRKDEETTRQQGETERAGAASKVTADAKVAAQKAEDEQADAYAKTLPADKQADFRQWYNNKKFLGTPNPESSGGTEVKNIPGSSVVGKVDAFGNPTTKEGTYTQTKDGKLYPEAPPPKPPAGDKDIPEVRERARVYEGQGLSPDKALLKAQADWQRVENDKDRAVNYRAEAAKPVELVPPEKLATLARVQVTTGVKPGIMFGLGKNDPNRVAYTIALADAYDKYPNATALQAAFKAGSAGLGQLNKMRDMVDAYEEDFKLDIQKAEEAAEDVPRTQSSKINSIEQLIKGEWSDYPELQKFQNYATTAANKYAKLVSSGSGGGVTTDDARRDAYRILNTSLAKHSFAAAVESLKVDAQNRLTAFDTAITKQEDKLKANGERLLDSPNTSDKKPTYTEQQVRDRAKKAGVNADEAVKNAKSQGLLK